VNTGASWPTSDEAWWRVQKMQTKLHQWAFDGPNRRFMDLFNLVYDPAFLVVAWERVRGNRGARTAGVDGVKPRSIVFGEHLLAGLRDDLKAERFTPLPVREKLIPKKGGKFRGLGIPTVPPWGPFFQVESSFGIGCCYSSVPSACWQAADGSFREGPPMCGAGGGVRGGSGWSGDAAGELDRSRARSDEPSSGD
jgi:hypothetical protein